MVATFDGVQPEATKQDKRKWVHQLCTQVVKKKKNVFPTFPGFYLKYYRGKLQYESCFCSLSKKISLQIHLRRGALTRVTLCPVNTSNSFGASSLDWPFGRLRLAESQEAPHLHHSRFPNIRSGSTLLEKDRHKPSLCLTSGLKKQALKHLLLEQVWYEKFRVSPFAGWQLHKTGRAGEPRGPCNELA